MKYTLDWIRDRLLLLKLSFYIDSRYCAPPLDKLSLAYTS